MKQRHLDSKAAARYMGYKLKTLYTLRAIERGPDFTRDPRTGKPLYTPRSLDAFLKAKGKKRAMTLAQACRKPETVPQEQAQRSSATSTQTMPREPEADAAGPATSG